MCFIALLCDAHVDNALKKLAAIRKPRATNKNVVDTLPSCAADVFAELENVRAVPVTIGRIFGPALRGALLLCEQRYAPCRKIDAVAAHRHQEQRREALPRFTPAHTKPAAQIRNGVAHADMSDVSH